MHSTTKPFSPVATHPPAIELGLDRAKPLMQIVSYLTIVTFVVWTGLQAIPRFAPQLLPQRLAGLGYAQDIQGRVDGAFSDCSQGLVPAGKPICAIVGFSGGQEGIDIVQLAEEDDLDVRYLGLCGACDGTITGLSQLVAPLYSSKLQANTIVMAINPFHLVVRPFTPSLDRSDIKHAMDKRLLVGRRQLLRLFQLDADPRYSEVDPWRPMTKNYFGVVPERVMKARLEQYRLRGYGDIENYNAGGGQGAELRSMIQASHETGAHVVIALMPIHPDLFRELPPDATEVLRNIVTDLDVDLLDYQQAIEAAGFYDVSHLSGEGRETFTSILTDDLRAIQRLRESAARKMSAHGFGIRS